MNGSTIYLYEEIYPYSAERFVADLKEKEQRYSAIKVRINSPGGSVMAAYTIFNAILNSPAAIDIYIDGIAASAASFIALAGKRIFMADYALIMWHNAHYNGYEPDEKEARALEAFNSSIVEIYHKRTGKDKEEIKTLMEAETWFDASQALEAGIVDEIITTDLKEAKKLQNAFNSANGQGIKDLHNNFNQLLNREKNMLKDIANALNVPEDKVQATITNMLAENKALSTENKDLKADNKALTTEKETLVGRAEDAENKVKEFEAAQAEKLKNEAAAFIQNAVKDRKIAKADAAEWQEMYIENSTKVSKLINNLPVNPKLSEFALDGGADTENKVSAWEAAKKEVIK